jgi:F-type H+-transporting ATPase subunit b
MEIKWPEIVTNILGFLLLFFGLKRFAWGPILGLLDARREKIGKDFAAAEEAKRGAEAIRTDYESKLREIDAMSRKKIEEAMREAGQLAAEMKEKAREESNAIVAKAQVEIERERAKARVALRDDMVQMVLKGVEKVLHERLTPGKQEELVSRFIDELEGLKA